MENTATSDNYIVNNFPDTSLLCLLIFQKKKVQRNASYKLNRSNLKKPKGWYTKLIFLCRNNACLKEDNSKSLTQGPQIVLNKCYRNI